MAQAPMSAAMPPSPGMDTDPTAGGDADSGGDVVVTICKNSDGSYTVYSGAAPDADDSTEMSEDDADAMGPRGDAAAPAGGAPAPQGQPADSIGAALKVAMDILQADKSSEGAPGNADDQLAAGFAASQSPTPASGPAQKY